MTRVTPNGAVTALGLLAASLTVIGCARSNESVSSQGDAVLPAATEPYAGAQGAETEGLAPPARQPMTDSTARALAERFVRALRGEPEHDVAFGPALMLEVDGKRSRHTATTSLEGALGIEPSSLPSLELDPATIWTEDSPSGVAVHAELRWSEGGRAEHTLLVLGVTRGDLDYVIATAVLQDAGKSADPPE